MQEFLDSKVFQTAMPILESLAIIVIGLVIYKICNKWINKLLKKTSLDPMVFTFVNHAFQILIWVIVIIAVLGKFGIDSSSIITVIAACGAAIALALQNSLSNLASGILTMTTRPFHKGDYIVCGGVAGTVDEIDLLTTKIRTDDVKVVVIPNSLLTSNTITNYTKDGARRYEKEIGVSYNTDIETARKVLADMLMSDSRTLKEPAPIADVVRYDDSAIVLKVKGWAKSEDYLRYECDMNNLIKPTLDKAGISIPFPQMDVHIDK
ncbi:MAG: mechanosensitive ion channel [Bacillota bacterium]|nr:mechanosensitive ion channel [Bacillota bacterium]